MVRLKDKIRENNEEIKDLRLSITSSGRKDRTQKKYMLELKRKQMQRLIKRKKRLKEYQQEEEVL